MLPQVSRHLDFRKGNVTQFIKVWLCMMVLPHMRLALLDERPRNSTLCSAMNVKRTSKWQRRARPREPHLFVLCSDQSNLQLNVQKYCPRPFTLPPIDQICEH